MRSARLMQCVALAAGSMYGQLTYDRLLKAESEPQNWLTYSGSYKGWRYSKLDQINRRNVTDLRLAWAYQMPATHRIETTPLVVNGVMYITEPPSNVIALDPGTGRQFWRYKRNLPSKVNVCCDHVNASQPGRGYIECRDHLLGEGQADGDHAFRRRHLHIRA